MSNVELTYEKDVLEPKVEPPKTLAEQQRDALLWVLKTISSGCERRQHKNYRLSLTKDDIHRMSEIAIAAVEAGKVPS